MRLVLVGSLRHEPSNCFSDGFLEPGAATCWSALFVLGSAEACMGSALTVLDDAGGCAHRARERQAS